MNFYLTCKAASLINYISDKICQDSSVIIVTSLRGGWWRNFGSCPSKENIFSPPYFACQLWGPPSLLFSGYRHFFSGVNWLGHDTDHSPQSNAEIQHDWHCSATLTNAFVARTEILLEMRECLDGWILCCNHFNLEDGCSSSSTQLTAIRCKNIFFFYNVITRIYTRWSVTVSNQMCICGNLFCHE